MSKDFSVRLMDRTAVVEYRDARGVYRFDLGQRGNEWTVYMPPSHEIPAEEADTILGRVTDYLESRRWFWIFPLKYKVKVQSK